MKKVFQLFFIGIVITLSACGKCTDTKISAKSNTYFTGFNKGSYWIYQNEYGDIDSIFVSFYKIINVTEGGKSLFGGQNCSSQFVDLQMNRFSGGKIIDSTKAWVFNDNDSLYLNSFDLFVNNTNYNNVISIFDNSSKFYYKPFYQKQYYAPNVGLIRWETNKSPHGLATYNLIKYKINPI